MDKWSLLPDYGRRPKRKTHKLWTKELAIAEEPCSLRCILSFFYLQSIFWLKQTNMPRSQKNDFLTLFQSHNIVSSEFDF